MRGLVQRDGVALALDVVDVFVFADLAEIAGADDVVPRDDLATFP